MKNVILCIAIGAVLSATIGCANGPIRNFFRGSSCNTCQPPAQPNMGFDNSCANGTCSTSSYMNDSYIQNDPYMNGSKAGGATINPPVFDGYEFPNTGGTIVSPDSSGLLPGPSGGG